MDDSLQPLREADTATLSADAVAPWVTPGPAKEAWKNQGNRYDYRDLKASRPKNLKITISGPRIFDNM